eukprot:UN21111
MCNISSSILGFKNYTLILWNHNIKEWDPDVLVCWDFNTKFGCTYPSCSWEHRPCRTTRAHPTKLGRICSPQHGLRNMQKENDELMKDQKEIAKLGVSIKLMLLSLRVYA